MTTGNGESRQYLLKEKKGLVVDEKSNRWKKTAATAAVAFSVIAAFLWYNFKSGDSTGIERVSSVDNIQVKPAEVNAEISVYDAGQFDDGRARFFKYTVQNTSIGYFIVKGTDGKIRAAFNACDVCWRAGKGYTQSVDVMVCNNCGRKFPLDMIGLVSGGCNPAPLESRLSGGKVIIQNKDIAEGLQYFRDIKGL